MRTPDSSVLLYSGGMDSYCLAALYRPTVLLSVDTGTRYGDVEQDRLRVPPGLEDRLVRVDFRSLAQLERPEDLILPGRNAHLVLLAANYGDTIYLAATAGDRVTDKDEVFVHLINGLLRHLYKRQWWLPKGRNVELQLPLKRMSKREIVAWYLRAGHDGELLSRDTFSCYDPREGRECGKCKPCVRKWIALVCNGIKPRFDATALFATYLDAVEDGTWDRGKSEADDVREAARLMGWKRP